MRAWKLTRTQQRLSVSIIGAFVGLLAFDSLYGASVLYVGKMSALLLVPPAVNTLVLLALTFWWPRSRTWMAAVCLVTALTSLVITVGWFILGGGNGLFPFTETAGVLALILLVTRWLSVRTAVGTAIVLTVAAIGIPLRIVSQQDSQVAAGVTSASVMWLLGCMIAAAVGGYLRTLDSLRARTMAELKQAQRLELARDLHDFVAHHVSGIIVRAQAAQVIAARDPAEAVSAFTGIEEAGISALASLRRTVGMLREGANGLPASGSTAGGGALEVEAADGGQDAAERAPMPGLDELPEMVERFSSTGSTRATLAVADGVTSSLPPEVTSSAYRVVLEALTNVRKHAPGATAVSVRLTLSAADPRALVVTVEDDGPAGTAPEGGAAYPPGGFGLTGLAERVDALGGRLTAGPAEAGWRVAATLPLSTPPPST